VTTISFREQAQTPEAGLQQESDKRDCDACEACRDKTSSRSRLWGAAGDGWLVAVWMCDVVGIAFSRGCYRSSGPTVCELGNLYSNHRMRNLSPRRINNCTEGNGPRRNDLHRTSGEPAPHLTKDMPRQHRYKLPMCSQSDSISQLDRANNRKQPRRMIASTGSSSD